MAFKREEVSQLLVQCHRRCCICHKFCGVKMETHHIESGNDRIENAIPVCFECHAEIRLYDESHPRGRKYQPDELRLHKERWLEICKNNPSIFITPLERGDVGPLHALIDEMEFNIEIAGSADMQLPTCRFRDIEFNRIITEGMLSLLTEEVRSSLMQTYRTLGELNCIISAIFSSDSSTHLTNTRSERLRRQMPSAKPLLEKSKELLIRFLAEEKD